MERRVVRETRAAAIAVLTLFGCAQQVSDVDETPETELGSARQAIIDGAPATGAKYGAVGALVYFLPEIGVLDVFCSGTLIAPNALVTARHCMPSIDLALESGLVPAVAFGPDAFNPTEVVPITGYVQAPAAPGNTKGLLLDGGRDVAVTYLASVPVGIKPAKLGQFDECQLGTQFEIAGYGMHNFEAFYGQRFAGLATARALHGRWYPLLFNGDYGAFHDWYFTDAALALPSEAEAKEWWKIYKLENKYELLAGGLPGEAVACYGDSGGPLLLGKNAKNLTVYGVSFAVEGTFSTLCGLGGGYLVFNRKMLDFVEGAL